MILVVLPGAHVAAATPTPISLNITGGIDNSGEQAYAQSGGAFLCTNCGASILGQPVVSLSTFTESVSSSTNGVATSGSASFSLSGSMLNGSAFSISGPIAISDSIPGEAFPLGCWDGVTFPLPATCTSDVPAFFVGGGTFDVTVTHSWSLSLGMDLESAFLNPFGGAIVWSSTDSATSPSILLVFNYTSATIDWTDVHLSGTISGTLDSTPVATPISGLFTQTTTSAHEDLFAGTETEGGTMTFLDMSPSGLDATGTYEGSSTIPTAGSVDCSAFTTGIPTTCTETGFSSSGSLALDGVAVDATYSLQWAVPALVFSGTATGTATPTLPDSTIPGVPQFPAPAMMVAAIGLMLFAAMKKRTLPKA